MTTDRCQNEEHLAALIAATAASTPAAKIGSPMDIAAKMPSTSRPAAAVARKAGRSVTSVGRSSSDSHSATAMSAR